MNFSVLIFFFLSASLAGAIPSIKLDSAKKGVNSFETKPVLLAQKKKKRKAKKKILQGEARGSASKTSIDFDAAAIDGERRAPVGVQVGGSKQNHGYDLINLRLRWHPEMIKSTSNLETGKSSR